MSRRPYTRSPRLSAGLIVLPIAALLTLAVGVQAVVASSPPPRQAGPNVIKGGPTYHGPLGIPAIQPRANLAGSSGPRYTSEDARQYVSTHRPPFTAPGSPNPVVISIQFLPAAQVSALLDGESMGVPDSTLLCLVRVSGTFLNTMVPLGMTPKPFHEGVMIFDAHTGNLLMSSVG